MKVKDEEGNIGIITLCKDIYSIIVKYATKEGGYGIYCLDPDSKVPIYNPLFTVE